MSWGGLLNKDPEEEIAELDKMHQDMVVHTTMLVEKKVEGRMNVNQYIMDAIKEVLEVRRRIVAKIDGSCSEVRKHAQRLALQTTLLLAGYHSRESAALDGYKALEVIKACLAGIRVGATLCSADFVLEDKRQTATKPSFTDIEYKGSVSFENIDLMVECFNTMGSFWSGWGELNYSFLCFEESENVYNHWKTNRSDKKDSETDQIQELLNESSKRASDSLQIREQEKGEQQSAFAQKLAARRKKKSGTGIEDTAAEQQEKPSMSTTADSSSLPVSSKDEGSPRAGQLERRFTQTCSCLAQLHKNNGDTVLSGHYCHLALQRQLEGDDRATNITSEWVANCINLAEYYTMVKDFSHAEHCLEAVKLLNTRGVSQDLDAQHDFAYARYCFNLLLLLQAEADELSNDSRPGNLDGVIINLVDNKNTVLPPEEEALLKDPAHAKKAAERLSFKLPIPPPKMEMVGNSSVVIELYETGSKLYRGVMAEYTIDTDCERHCLVHLELQQLIGCYQHFISITSDSASARLDLCYERLNLLQVLLNDGFDELVFRNVLRQVHYGIGCISQEIAELIVSQGMDAEKSQPYYQKAAEHFEKFSERFLKEFREVQKATSDPTKRSAFLKLEGSDAPAYVIGEMRHAQVLAKLGTTDMKDIVAKYKGVVRFIETNPKAVAEYPELKQHLTQVKEIVKLLQSGTDLKKVKTRPDKAKKR